MPGKDGICRAVYMGSIILALIGLGMAACFPPVPQNAINENLERTQANDNNTTITGTAEAVLPTGTYQLTIREVAINNIQDHSLTVTWKTNWPSTSGLSALPVGGVNTVGSWPDKRLLTEHKVILKNLEPSTAYLLTLTSKDASGNQDTFTTNCSTRGSRTSMELIAGDAAPDFTLKSMKGDSVRLPDFRGKWIMIVFWMTRCDSCKQEIQYLNNFHSNYKLDDCLLLSINVGENDAYTTNLIIGQKLIFPVLLDEEEEVSEKYSIVHFPTAIIIDPYGTITKIKEDTFKSELEIIDFVRSAMQSK